MKVLLIHTCYTERGGEDAVFESENSLLAYKNVEVETLLFNNDRYVLMNLLLAPFNIVSYYRVIEKIKQYRPDVIHVHNWHFAASPSIIWAAKRCKVPVVLTLHNYRMLCPSGILFHQGELYFDSLTGGFPWKAVQKKVYRNSAVLTFWLSVTIRLHKRLGTWSKVDHFITLTEFARQIFLQSDIGIKSEKISVKPNFVKLQSPHQHPKKEVMM